jgi:predicted MFS family arabinose efflux permease
MTTATARAAVGDIERPTAAPLPWPALLVLAGIAFVALVSEVAPAGLLHPMATDLSVSDSGAGLLVTAFALSAGFTAIPAIALTRSWPRRELMLAVVAGYTVVNLGTAVTSSYPLMLAVRVVGGVCTGLMWSLVGTYATQLVEPEQRGRALTIAMAGGTIAFSTGVPASSVLGALVGWRASFAALALLGVVLFVLAARLLPPVPGEPAADRPSFFTVLRLPGIAPVAGVVVAMVIGHNVLYTYIEPFVDRSGLAGGVGLALLLSGVGSFVGMWLTARYIDVNLRRTILVSLWAVLGAMAVLGIGGRVPLILLAGTALWGVAYGGLAALTQTAAAKIGGSAADVAVSVMVTAWSIAIACGALIGGFVLDRGGAGLLPWIAGACFALAIAGVTAARVHGFPPPDAA